MTLYHSSGKEIYDIGVKVSNENHGPATTHWQTLSHQGVSSTPRHGQKSLSISMMVGTDHRDLLPGKEYH